MAACTGCPCQEHQKARQLSAREAAEGASLDVHPALVVAAIFGLALVGTFVAARGPAFRRAHGRPAQAAGAKAQEEGPGPLREAARAAVSGSRSNLSEETESDMPELIPVTPPPSVPSLPSCDHLLEDLGLSPRDGAGWRGGLAEGSAMEPPWGCAWEAPSLGERWSPIALAGALRAVSLTDREEAEEEEEEDELNMSSRCYPEESFGRQPSEWASEEPDGTQATIWPWEARTLPGCCSWSEEDEYLMLTLNRPMVDEPS